MRVRKFAAWHALPVESVLEAFESGPRGLSSEEARARLERHGRNRLGEERGVPVWGLVLDQVRNPLVLILVGAALLLGVVSLAEEGAGRLRDAALILAIVVLGFVQNYRAPPGH